MLWIDGSEGGVESFVFGSAAFVCADKFDEVTFPLMLFL